MNELPAYLGRSMNMRAAGASYAEVAAATGVAVGTVKSRINRGRAMLRERLEPFDDLLPSR
jgi:RNA polymerase sigma-70 factor (ECF subfamily)